VNDNENLSAASDEDTLTPSGISKTKRTKVGCNDALTRTGGRFCFVRRLLNTQRPLRGDRTIRQLLDDFRGQCGRKAAPLLGKKVDKHPLSSRHHIDAQLLRQCHANGRAVRIAANRSDIGRGCIRKQIDRNGHLSLELDDKNGACDRNLGRNVFLKLKHQPRITLLRRQRRLAPDRISVGGMSDTREHARHYNRSKSTEKPVRKNRTLAPDFRAALNIRTALQDIPIFLAGYSNRLSVFWRRNSNLEFAC
jgi:hypothetical protein